VEEPFQLFNVYEVNYVRQTEIHTVEPLVPESNTLEVEMAIEKLKRHRSPGLNQILAELIKEGGRAICSEFFKPINSM
jgi:hypothetical protein